MISILTEVRVENWDHFIAVFTTRGKEARTRHGCRRSVVYRMEDPQEIRIVFDWESREAFEAFLANPQVQATMKSSGTVQPPRFTYLDRVCEIPG